jgi:Heterokaryon incompatibility protein (HET)
VASGGEGLQPRLIDNTIDFSIVRDWLHLCETKHRPCSSLLRQRSPSALTLINGCARRLEKHTDSPKYVALSYVWGSRPPVMSSKEHEFHFPIRLEQVIEDAMTVCKKVGITYLWVDRYCISEESGKRQEEIAMMDRVYAGAQFTIIAAAGDDPSYGLPGISRKRRKQPRAHVSGFHLATTLGSPKSLTHSSKWITRGWTFQEEILSPRRLFFTDSQIYFECQESKFQETVEYLPKERFSGCDTLVASGARVSSQEERFWSLKPFDAIEIYSRRELSRPNDILNAMLGVLRAIAERKENPMLHFWGIPVKIVPEGHSKLAAFLSHLWWNPMKPTTRREGFPSWSWTGWFGEICWDGSKSTTGGYNRRGLSIDVELSDRETQPWAEFYSRLKEGHSLQFTRHLRISAQSLQLKLSPLTKKNEQGEAWPPEYRFRNLTKPHYFVEGPSSTFWPHRWFIPLRLTKQDAEVDKRLLTVVLVNSWIGVKCLVVDYVDCCWERVGILDTNDVQYDGHSARNFPYDHFTSILLTSPNVVPDSLQQRTIRLG